MTTLDARLTAAELQLADRRRERADCLKRLNAAPGDAQVDQMLAAVETEIAALQTTIKRLRDARDEAASRAAASTHADRVAGLEADRREVDRLADEMLSIAEQFYAHMQACRPLLELFVELGARRSALVSDILGQGTANYSERAGRKAHATLDVGPLSALIEAALRDAGIGALGPTRNIVVPHAPQFPGRNGRVGPPGQSKQVEPDKSDAWREPGADAVALVREWMASESSGTAAALIAAIDVVRARAPADALV